MLFDRALGGERGIFLPLVSKEGYIIIKKRRSSAKVLKYCGLCHPPATVMMSLSSIVALLLLYNSSP